MRGQVLTYDTAARAGLISGQDGVRYQFVQSDWNSPNEPYAGQQVDFEIDGKTAKQVLILCSPAMGVGPKNRMAAAVLAFMLGAIGVHKFYLGQTKLGIVYLLFFWTFIPAIVAFIEFIIYLCMSDAEFDRRYNSMTQ